MVKTLCFQYKVRGWGKGHQVRSLVRELDSMCHNQEPACPTEKKKISYMPQCWERLKVGREGNDRGRDGWMASPAQWT